MVIGLLVNGHAYTVKSRGRFCHVDYFSVKLSAAMYTSYFILFAHFFVQTYFVKRAEGVKLNSEKKLK